MDSLSEPAGRQVAEVTTSYGLTADPFAASATCTANRISNVQFARACCCIEATNAGSPAGYALASDYDLTAYGACSVGPRGVLALHMSVTGPNATRRGPGSENRVVRVDTMFANDKKRDAGFTLVELAITMALTVVAMAIVAPQTAKTFHQTAVRSAANEVEAAHRLARTVAIQYGRRASLQIGSANGGGFRQRNLLTVSVDTTVAATGEVAVRAFALRSVNVVSDRMLLCFDARGLPHTDGECEEPDATVIVKSNKNSGGRGARADTIRFSPLGDRLP